MKSAHEINDATRTQKQKCMLTFLLIIKNIILGPSVGFQGYFVEKRKKKLIKNQM